MSTGFLKAPLLAVIFAGLLGLYGPTALAEVDDLGKKVQQCEALFKQAHSPDVSQKEAREAEQKHFKLMIEILGEMNARNAAQEEMSSEQMKDNMRVMGRLLEMLARRSVPNTTAPSYLY